MDTKCFANLRVAFFETYTLVYFSTDLLCDRIHILLRNPVFLMNAYTALRGDKTNTQIFYFLRKGYICHAIHINFCSCQIRYLYLELSKEMWGPKKSYYKECTGSGLILILFIIFQTVYSQFLYRCQYVTGRLIWIWLSIPAFWNIHKLALK